MTRFARGVACHHLIAPCREAGKYTQNSRMIAVQAEMAQRCIELLNFPDDAGPQLVLDVGCGSGLSGGACARLRHRGSASAWGG